MSMATLSDVYETYNELMLLCKIFGCGKELLQEINNVASEIGEALAKEQKIANTPEGGGKLSKETILGPDAETKLEKLKVILEMAHRNVKGKK
jgi:hypothetical protein